MLPPTLPPAGSKTPSISSLILLLPEVQGFSSSPESGKSEREGTCDLCCDMPGYCEGLPCSASVPAPALAQPHTTGQGRLLHQSHIRDNPRVSSTAGVGDGHFRSGLLLLSILTGVKHTEHPHQDTTSGRQQGPSQGTEIPCCIHPNAEHHLPLKISLQKGKKKNLAGSPGLALPPSCSRFMWLQRLSHFQRHTNPANGCLTAHCVCSDTAPLPRKNNSERVWMRVYTKGTLLAFLQLC